MQLRPIAIAVGLTFAAATAGPALMSSAAFAKDHSHAEKSDHGDHGSKGHDRKDGNHDHHHDHKGDHKGDHNHS